MRDLYRFYCINRALSAKNMKRALSNLYTVELNVPWNFTQKIRGFLLSTFSATFFTVPKFIQASLPRVIKISAKVGDSIELDCSSDGHPHLEALWYKYNIPLLDITYRKLEGSLKFRKLVLNNLLLVDAGNYSCWVNGTLGSSNRTFILYVFGEYGLFWGNTLPNLCITLYCIIST